MSSPKYHIRAKAALAAILLGLALPPVAFVLMWYFGELIYQATS